MRHTCINTPLHLILKSCRRHIGSSTKPEIDVAFALSDRPTRCVPHGDTGHSGFSPSCRLEQRKVDHAVRPKREFSSRRPLMTLREACRRARLDCIACPSRRSMYTFSPDASLRRIAKHSKVGIYFLVCGQECLAHRNHGVCPDSFRRDSARE